MESVVALEGLHALKHAVRFGAVVTDILTDDLDAAMTTADQVAPDLRALLEEQATVVPVRAFRERARGPVHTHVLAYAHPPQWRLADALPTADRPTILLDDPRNSKNLGAVVRVAAAAGAAGVLANGDVDFCDTAAVRGAAGLQWAVPCQSTPTLISDLAGYRSPLTDHRPGFTLVGLDADGTPFDPSQHTGPTMFAFGSERSGLSDEVRQACDAIVSLPMAPLVSSLNLATTVSAVLYLRMYCQDMRPSP
ncbi:MAG: TrmH family RNA methyltransferase [Propionibacteriaceae bacterium]|nr:TrmH family RNA methyltransferase [Propionibacteriaceae bacterium]